MEIERLLRIPLLSSIDPDQLRRCISEKQIFLKKYAKGATVHGQHDRCIALDVVLTGALAAYALSENGSAVTMFEFRGNGIIGANILFGDDNLYPLNIFSVTACELLHVTKDAVVDLLHDHEFVMHYIKSLSRNSQGMNRKITMLTQKTLRENLLDYLRQQALIQGSSDVRLPISKKELADYLGVQRPSLFRELKRMEEEGMVDIANRTIRILPRASEPRGPH